MTLTASRFKNITSHISTLKNPRNDPKIIQIGAHVPEFCIAQGSGVELRTLDYDEPGSNPVCSIKILGKFFSQVYYRAIDSGGYVYEPPSRINFSIWLDASQRR